MDKFLLLTIVGCILFYIYKHIYLSNKEQFALYPSNMGVNDYPANLHDILTKDCKMDYCNINNWTTNPPKIPCGYDVSNFSTAKGCCIIPIELKNMMNMTRGNTE